MTGRHKANESDPAQKPEQYPRAAASAAASAGAGGRRGGGSSSVAQVAMNRGERRTERERRKWCRRLPGGCYGHGHRVCADLGAALVVKGEDDRLGHAARGRLQHDDRSVRLGVGIKTQAARRNNGQVVHDAVVRQRRAGSNQRLKKKRCDNRYRERLLHDGATLWCE